MPVIARLESRDGESLGEVSLKVAGWDWQQSRATIRPTRTDDHARFVLLATATGGIVVDQISLFPRNTFHNRPNGLRSDLAQAIADLHPKFVRFPGGCVAHGSGINNIYRWKDTIGPVEQRRGQKNCWWIIRAWGWTILSISNFARTSGPSRFPSWPPGSVAGIRIKCAARANNACCWRTSGLAL